MKAIQIEEHGGPDVLNYTDVPTPSPDAGQVLVRIKAAGLNYIDTYHRTGLYSIPLPAVLGLEAAGIVEAVGPKVSNFKPGDHVAYASSRGAYAEYAVVPVDQLVPVPADLDFNRAAAALLQGMTAHYLAHSSYMLKKGDTALIHAAAGGTGLLLVQIAKLLGATVIGTVSTAEKADLAREAGADHIIRYTEQDFETETKRITADAGVNVVYDSVGLTTFEKSLNCLRPRGYMVLFGQSSGAVPPFNPGLLAQKGSLFLTRPSLFHYVAEREDLLWRAGDILGWIKEGHLNLRIDRVMPLAEAAEAHRLLEGRKTAGKVLLTP